MKVGSEIVRHKTREIRVCVSQIVCYLNVSSPGNSDGVCKEGLKLWDVLFAAW